MRYRVVFVYESDRLVRSRYGATRAIEEAVRFVEADQLDEAVEEFRLSHDVVEVRIEKRA